jgi:hypothetical protein
VEIGAEGGLVGRELDGEPLRRVGLGRNHYRTFGAAATVASLEISRGKLGAGGAAG